MECPQCGMQSINPLPDKHQIDEIYSDYYQAWGVKEAENCVSDMKKRTFKGYMDEIVRYVSVGKLLDIGCATGEFLMVAQERGFNVYGVEISPCGVDRCKKLFGENKIVAKNISKNDFPENYFDVITLSDVIEHIPDQEQLLDSIYCMLKPQGVLMVVTPDTSSWLRKVMGMKWLHYKEEHIYYYNRFNISRYFCSKFDNILIDKAYKVLNLQYCLSVLSVYSKSSILLKIVKLLKKLPERIRRCVFRIGIGEMFVLFRKK